MATPEASPVPVTLAEIARIAGFGRAAVSNWRRRYDDFPPPIGGSDSSPQFDLTEVRTWLQENGKFRAQADWDWLWPEFEALGDQEAIGATIAHVGWRLLHDGDDQCSSEVSLGRAQQRVADKALELARKEGDHSTFDFLLRRFLETHVRQVTATPSPMAALMAEVASGSYEQAEPPGTVLDPACGAGGLLVAAAQQWAAPGDYSELHLLGQETDGVLASLAEVRLAFTIRDHRRLALASAPVWEARVNRGDTLLDDPRRDVSTDVILCHPPSNERGWGHEQLTTDPRWSYGLPPRTEPELAWVQHSMATLAPGGTAVMLLPPAVASRKAGRRIRAALLRSGVVRAVIALPPGCAPPHSVSLHLWVLRAPPEGPAAQADNALLLVDANDDRAHPAGGAESTGKQGMDWASLRATIMSAVLDRGASHASSIRVPVLDLLDEQVDLTPGRHVPTSRSATGPALSHSWRRFTIALDEVQRLSSELSQVTLRADDSEAQDTITLGELAQAGAVSIRPGQTPPEGSVQQGPPATKEGIPFLALPDLLASGGASGWIASRTAAGQEQGITITAANEVVVAASSRVFDAWVDSEAPTAVGPQMFVLRPDPAQLDPWFLAGCLRAPANARQASSHATSSSRVDVKRLQVLRMSLRHQQTYGEVFRRLTCFEQALRTVNSVGRSISDSLGDALAAGSIQDEIDSE